jgi:hypothetical protein
MKPTARPHVRLTEVNAELATRLSVERHNNAHLRQALEAIANMQVQESTDFRELAALCMSIANITLQGAGR